MDKGKILGLSNTEDSMWYRFAPEDLTLEILDEVFDIYDNLDEDVKERYSYTGQTKIGEISFIKETPQVIVYFIFTKEKAYLILRKTLNWGSFNKKITEKFDFVEPKN